MPSSPLSRSFSVRLVVVVLAGLLAAGLLSSSALAARVTGQLSGVVHDPAGGPEVGAQVTLVDSSGVTVASDTTGSAGRYKITVAPGRYDVAVVTADSPVRRIARVRGVDVGSASTLGIVVLSAYVTLSGVVRDLGGAPLHGGRIAVGELDTDIDSTGHYALRVHPGTYPLSITVAPDNNTRLYAAVKAITVTQDRVQDLTFGVTTLVIDGRDERQQPAAVAGVSLFSPSGCQQDCPAGFEMFPGSGEAMGYWDSFERSDTVLALPGRLVFTASPVDPSLAQVTQQPVAAPWPNPLPIVFADAPPPPQTPPPAPTVTWTGTVRHNGVPVAGASLDISGTPGSVDTDDGGRFQIQLAAGHHSMNLAAPIGTTFAADSSGPPPGTQIKVSDFDISADQTVDIEIPTATFTVHTVDENGQPISAAIGGTSSGANNAGAPVEIFPGGHGLGWLDDSSTTDAAGTGTLLMFPGSAPSTVYASSGYGNGSASPALSDQSATVRLVAPVTVTLSGTVRDPRGPLPLVNSPWISFGGQGSGDDLFTGDELNPDGTYALTTTPGPQTLSISNEPEYTEGNTYDYTATATLPQVWIITSAVNMAASKTLDVTIPDAAPARFSLVDTDGVAPTTSQFEAASTHTVNLGSGVSGQAQASTFERNQPTFEHMMFGPATVNGGIGYYDDNGAWNADGFLLPIAPGDETMLAASTNFDGGDLMPPLPSTPPSVPPATAPGATPDPGTSTATTSMPKAGYWALGSDGHVYDFGDAAALGNAAVGAVDLEPTPTGKGYWVLNRNGSVQVFGDAMKLSDVDMSKLAKGEQPASLSATPTGKGYWVFTNRGRVMTFGDAPFLGDMGGTTLNGPVLGSVATPSGKGYYMVASDGGIFAFGDATFDGSMGGKKLNASVQSLVPDGDGHGYWLVASDGGIFAFDALFRGSMGATRLNKPVVGMVRYGDGYLMVGADGGIFNFSSSPFAGSLGDKPPASPVVAVAALP